MSKNKASTKLAYKEPEPNQKGLEKFLGISAPARQQRLSFDPSTLTSTPTSTSHAMSGEASLTASQAHQDRPKESKEVKMHIDEDEDAVVKGPAKKRRGVIADSSDVEEEEGAVSKEHNNGKPSSIKEPSPKKVKIESTPARNAHPTNEKGRAALTSGPATASGPTSTSSTKATKSATKGVDSKPPVSSFFAPRKPAPPKAAPVASTSQKKVEPEEEPASSAPPKDEAEQDDGDDEDDDESEEDTEAAVKFAEIFTRNDDVASTKKGWEAGKDVPYSALADTFELIAGTTKRLEITAMLTKFLISVIEKTPSDLLRTVYLCINRLAPDYESIELGIGESLLMKAICQSTGRKMDQIKSEFKTQGDLGLVAMTSRAKQLMLQKPPPLTVKKVFDLLKNVATVSGKDVSRWYNRLPMLIVTDHVPMTVLQSQSRKIGFIQKLLLACEGIETKYIIRSLEGKLRIGLAERTASFVTAETRKEGRHFSHEKMAQRLEEGTSILKDVFSQLPSYDLVIPALVKHGISNLKENCHLTPGVPLKPMLAKPTKAISEVLDRFEDKLFTCEYKYDGERAQVHYLEGGSIKIFSRNSEDMSQKYPDIIEQLPACINRKAGTTSFVIDCEAVAWDPEEKTLLPFQELSRRRRKDVKAEEITVKVHLFAFDLLYLNGKALLGENLIDRRQLLRTHLRPVPEQFDFATSEDATTVEQIQEFLELSIKGGCEGLMVKMLEGEGATYEPSRRSIHWLKLKKDYLDGHGDTFDLVVVGADFGSGKRTGVYGALHLACFDDESQTFQAICKTGTGFEEKDLVSLHARLTRKTEDGDDGDEGEGELSSKPHDVDFGRVVPKNLPGQLLEFRKQFFSYVYFAPSKSIVIEVKAADLSLSPVYPAAVGKCDSRGISMRFPRFERVRDDKAPEQATDSDQVAEAYRRQAIISKPGKYGGGGDDGGFY
ncbi:BQ2448_7792 [Microbotryum intermedium]|uniref:DNA ligase n=1 Tax=Microbotryum intermedium TaxID=269621 RepID=A0A238FS26_9BASI|nr:BQ2448_7792 [Microbotryum intermedium]